MPTFNNGESGASVRSKINAAIQEVDNVSGDIVGTTGTQTLTNKTLTSPDINGGSVDGVTLGTNSAVTEAQVDNINIDGNTISSTDTNGDINLEPDGTGGVVTTKTITAAQYDSTESLPDIKPSLNLDFANVKKLDPRITYTRASTGTYYDGKTFAKAEENLHEQSQAFSTSPWSSVRINLTGSQTAPDGTSTAFLLEQQTGETTAGNIRQTDKTLVAGQQYTSSIFAKADAKDFLRVDAGYVANGTVFFDLVNGTVETTNVGIDSASIFSVGGGWYRCSVQFTVGTATQTIYYGPADTDGSATVTDSGGIILWGAQLEQRDALTDYTPTTTQPITNYVPALQTAASGVARFDHDPITSESLGFLIEEQRTNLFTYSEEFDNATYTKSRSSITSNIVVAPDGTLTGDKLVEDTTASNTHELIEGVSGLTAQAYTLSVYAKAAERDHLQLTLRDGAFGANIARVDFDLTNETSSIKQGTVDSSTITAVGNGWYRVSITATGTTTGSSNAVIYLSNNGSVAYTGDGYSGVYLWGAMLESGSFPTSYVKTTSAQATRNADAASMTGTNFSEWYNAGEGVLFADYSKYVASASTSLMAAFISDNSLNNFIKIGNQFAQVLNDFRIATNNVTQTGITGQTALADYQKKAFAFKFNDAAAYVDGGSIGTGSVLVMPRVSQINIGARNNNQEFLNGHIRKLAYYPQRLSNSTIQALTEE